MHWGLHKMRIQFTNFVSPLVFSCFYIYWIHQNWQSFFDCPVVFYRTAIYWAATAYTFLCFVFASALWFLFGWTSGSHESLIWSYKTISCYPCASFCFSLLSWSPAVFLFTLSASKAICPRCIINKHICGKIGHGKTSLWFYFCCKFILTFSRRFFL